MRPSLEELPEEDRGFRTMVCLLAQTKKKDFKLNLFLQKFNLTQTK
jgi:hypothetical protein